MRKIVWMSIVFCSVLIVVAQDTNTFSSRTVGFSVQKPPHWYFMTAESNAENLSRTRMQDEEFQKMVQKYATAPLVVITKYQEPYDNLNPSFKVNMRALGNLDGTDPVSIISLVRASLQKAFKDYKEVQPPMETKVAGLKSAYMKVNYTLQTSDGQAFPTSSELWIVPRRNYFFIIGVGTSQNSDSTEKEEVQSIMKSIKIE